MRQTGMKDLYCDVCASTMHYTHSCPRLLPKPAEPRVIPRTNEFQGKLTEAEHGAKCGRCGAPLRVRENGGNMCQPCLNRMFR